ncbi:hypothetical protein Hanom_Chr10g00940251 [Helianthus anomalus]
MTQCSQLRCALVVGEGVNLSQTSFAVVVFLKRKFQRWKTSYHVVTVGECELVTHLLFMSNGSFDNWLLISNMFDLFYFLICVEILLK